jgi:hypothetical protein
VKVFAINLGKAVDMFAPGDLGGERRLHLPLRLLCNRFFRYRATALFFLWLCRDTKT